MHDGEERAKRPRKSDDSGFAEAVMEQEEEADEMDVRMEMEIPDSDEERMALAFEMGTGPGVGLGTGTATDGGVPRQQTWMPEPDPLDEMHDTPLEELKQDHMAQMALLCDIQGQLLEIFINGGRGKSSKGLDVKYLNHNKAFVEERVKELQAEISRRGNGSASNSPAVASTSNLASTRPALGASTSSVFRPGGSTLVPPPPSTSSKGKGRAFDPPAPAPAQFPTPPADFDDLCGGVDFDDFSVDGTQRASHPSSRSHPPPPPARQPPPPKKREVMVIDDDESDDDAPIVQRPRAPPSRQPPPPQPIPNAARARQPPPAQPQPVASTSARRNNTNGEGLPSIIPAEKKKHPWSRDVDKALRQRFGLLGFRKNQQEAVDGTLGGRDVFVLLPTGGGKSLCYQLPAVIQTGTTKGVTVVISPLLSLMEDQCKALYDKDIPVVSVNSTMPAADKNHAMATMRANPPDCSLVYLTPEQIVKSGAMKSILRDLYRRHQLARFVLDEAHCVSSWGHDFRPDYKAMSTLKQDFPGIPLMALTATASRRVRTDVISNLGMDNPILLSASFNRSNLHYEVRPKSKNIINEIVDFISDPKYKGKCGIIYCFSQKQCEDTALKLRDKNINARHYHAGMSAGDRSRIQRGWQEDEFQVICATIAFGMGIDKPDVRYVIHYSIPKNLEGYYQETGRAGRDGKTSMCLLFYAYSDTAALYHHINESDGSPENKEHNREMIRLVVQYCLNVSDCRRRQVLGYFNENFNAADCHATCDNCAKGGTVETKDVSDLAKKAIKLIQGFQGAEVTLVQAVDIFRGSQTAKIKQSGWNELEGFGEGKQAVRNDVERLFQLMNAENIFAEQFKRSALGYTHAYIKLGPKHRDVLSGKQKVLLGVADPKKIAQAQRALEMAGERTFEDEFYEDHGDEDNFVDLNPVATQKTVARVKEGGAAALEDCEQQCWHELKKLRDEARWEPEMLMPDATLQLVAAIMPVNCAEFCAIDGCTEEIYDLFHPQGGKAICTKWKAKRDGVEAPPVKYPGFSRPVVPQAPTRPPAPVASTSKAPPRTTSTSTAVRKVKAPTPKSTAKTTPSGIGKPSAAKAKSAKGTGAQMSLDRFRFSGGSSTTSKPKAGGVIRAMKVSKHKSFFSSSKKQSAASDFIDRDSWRGDDEDGGSYSERRQRPTLHVPSRPVDRDKTEAELNLNIKKATSPEETAPKQKHVRKCIVYTWDYHTSASIWSALRVQPILSDEVQTFKALITVHKVLQEGHPNTLKEAQNQIGWLETCARTVGGDVSRGYGALIRAYVTLILAKLKFHKHHPDFNGLFEYEEYISLRGVDDPNEGYETISDLMNLQDSIDSFQKLIFAHFRGSANNECRISALVPQVKESYGIYRFITSMMRAMHRRTDAMDALEPLRDRYDSQHFGLRKFYYECSNLKYLTGLINVPKLPQEPPNLLDAGDAPDLPRRPAVKSPTPPPAAPSPRVDLEEQKRALLEYEEKQAALVRQREADQRRLEEEQARQQREFEEQQRLQQERERQQQEELIRQQQMQMQMGQMQASQGRLAELEREILSMRGQWERDQMMLERYDARVKALEGELVNVSGNIQQQLASKDQMIGSLQDQVTLWRNKYEALAKLYSQLRNEHLEMLSKYKSMQLKANSAQEAIDKMERMERDVKAKNLELADMIRERDRARFDVDRMKSSQKDELERLKRDLRFAEERADDAARSKGSEVSGLLGKYNRQLEELESSLRSKQIQIDDLLHKIDEKDGEAERIRDEKDTEIAIMQEGMDATIRQISELQANQGETDDAVNAQIDNLVLDQEKKFNEIIDSILQAGSQKVDDALYELESPLHDGNQNSTPEYTLSMIEKATTSATEFAMVFNLFLSREKGGEHVEVIKTANNFAQSIAEVLTNTKGLSRIAPDDAAIDSLTKAGKIPGDAALRFFTSLQSYRLQGMPPASRKEVAVRNNMETKNALQKLSTAVEGLAPKGKSSLAKANGDIGDLVESEMMAAARAIEDATAKLQALMSRPKDSRTSATDLQVHDAILAASLAITNAIGRLIKAATDSQQEIVAQGRGSSTSAAFYKRNNRWTEGLISAARAVAVATTFLIETADGVINGHKTLEQLIVASNEVASATAQLVQASRVKAELMSKTQETLELAAKAVTEACKALVRQVKAITAKQLENQDDVDYDRMQVHEFKIMEMEVQVSIVTLEKELAEARRRLGAMRRSAYHAEDDTA